jgi:hypothetical protein
MLAVLYLAEEVFCVEPVGHKQVFMDSCLAVIRLHIARV